MSTSTLLRMTPEKYDAAIEAGETIPGPILLIDDPDRPAGAPNRAQRRARYGVPRGPDGRTRHQRSIHARAVRRNAIRYAKIIDAAHAEALRINEALDAAASEDAGEVAA